MDNRAQLREFLTARRHGVAPMKNIEQAPTGRVRAELGDRGSDGDRAVWGDADGVAAAVKRFAAVGIDDVVLVPAAGEPDFGGFLGAVGDVAWLVA